MSPTIYLMIIAGFLISFLFQWIIEKEIELDIDNLLEYQLRGAFIGFVAGVGLWVALGNQPESYEYEKPQRDLAALQDNMNTSGSFFLGSGNIDGELWYYGYENLGDDRFKMVKFPNEHTIIIEDIKDSTQTPYFIEIRERADTTDPAFLPENAKWRIGPFVNDDFVRWEVHIPKGSILREYNLDLN